MKKCILSFSIALILVACLAQTSFATYVGINNFTKNNSYTSGRFLDVSPSDWFEESVIYTYELGLMNGSSEATFNPTGNITLSETIVIAARLHSIYFGEAAIFGKSSPWYQAYIDYAINSGILKENYKDYTAKATRSQFASILASALPDEALIAINNIKTIPDVSQDTSYSSAVYKLYNAGILAGNDAQGTFAPNSHIRRSEVAAVIARMANLSYRQKVTQDNTNMPAFNSPQDIAYYISGSSQYNKMDTPCGTYYFKFLFEEHGSYAAVDGSLRVDFIGTTPWYDLKYSTTIPELDKQKTIEQLKKLQVNIYELFAKNFPDYRLHGGYYYETYKYPTIKKGKMITSAMSWRNCVGEEVSGFYWLTEYDTYKFFDNDNQELDTQIKTVSDLERYLNKNMSSCTTPMGTYTYEFELTENTVDFYGYDIRIQTGHKYDSPWSDIEYSIAISDTDKRETIKVLREFQREVYEVAAKAFPDKKVYGGFFDSSYTYPNIKVGYRSTAVLSWSNYSGTWHQKYNTTKITEFNWDSSFDDYKFDY